MVFMRPCGVSVTEIYLHIPDFPLVTAHFLPLQSELAEINRVGCSAAPEFLILVPPYLLGLVLFRFLVRLLEADLFQRCRRILQTLSPSSRQNMMSAPFSEGRSRGSGLHCRDIGTAPAARVFVFDTRYFNTVKMDLTTENVVGLLTETLPNRLVSNFVTLDHVDDVFISLGARQIERCRVLETLPIGRC